MAVLFFQNFTKETRTAMEAAGFKLPARPPNETRDQVYARVAAVKEWAVKAERGISANMQALARVTGNRLTAKGSAFYSTANEAPQLRAFMGQTGEERLHSGFRDDDFAEAAALAEDVGISPEKVMALQASMRTNEHARTPNTDNRGEEEFFNVMA
eukprot:9924724-Ditylum_brightwellii.AAC.1